MSRAATALDRLVAIAVGLLLIAVGAGAIIWNTDVLNGIPEYLTAPGLALSVQSWWWPWAVAAAGVILVLLALRWLAAHGRATRVHTMPLAGSGENGAITADLGSIANAAARRLELDPSVDSAKATAFVDRGRRIMDITVTATSTADISAAATAADRVCCEAVTMLGDDTVATRTRIRLKTTNRVRRVS